VSQGAARFTVGGRLHSEPATPGEVVIETFTGTMGPSVRAVVPVTDGDQVRGLVAAGVGVAAVSQELDRQVPVLFGFTLLALLLAGFGSWLASRDETKAFPARTKIAA